MRELTEEEIGFVSGGSAFPDSGNKGPIPHVNLGGDSQTITVTGKRNNGNGGGGDYFQWGTGAIECCSIPRTPLSVDVFRWEWAREGADFVTGLYYQALNDYWIRNFNYQGHEPPPRV